VITVKAKKDFPRSSGDGQSRQLVSEGAEIEVSEAEARNFYARGYINKPKELEVSAEDRTEERRRRDAATKPNTEVKPATKDFTAGPHDVKE
jgi:hypothetical protein